MGKSIANITGPNGDFQFKDDIDHVMQIIRFQLSKGNNVYLDIKIEKP